MGKAEGLLVLGAAALAAAAPALAQAPIPDAIAAKGEVAVSEVHGEGAQVYECRTGQGGMTWQLREPIATLLRQGKTVGRHYAGPTWELLDGSLVIAKVAGRAAAAKQTDIPWLRLEVTDRRGAGELDQITTIQRVNTKGGQAQGPCPKEGEFLSVPYAADYVFLRKRP